MKLPIPTRAPRKRSETRDLVAPIIRALNRLPGVRVARNANLGPVTPWAQRFTAEHPILAGLGTGSADIVGIVVVSACCSGPCRAQWHERVGRAFALEVKLAAVPSVLAGVPGLRAGTLAPDQKRWLDAFRRFSGFAAVVHSKAEALAAVDRCRQGHDH